MTSLSTYSISLEAPPQSVMSSPPSHVLLISCDGGPTLCRPHLTAAKLGVRSDAAAELLAIAVARSVSYLKNRASPLLAQFTLLLSDAIRMFSRIEMAQEVSSPFVFTLSLDDDHLIHRQLTEIALSCGNALRHPPDMMVSILPLVHLLCTFTTACYKKKQPAIDVFYSAVGWHTLRYAADMCNLHQTQSAYSKLWPPYGSAIEYVRSGPSLDPKHACLKDVSVREAVIVFIERQAIRHALYNAVMYHGSDAFSAGDHGNHESEIIVRAQSSIINSAIQAVRAQETTPVIC